MCIPMHVCIYTYTYIHMYMYIYMHTYIYLCIYRYRYMNAYMNDPLFLVERGQADLHLRRRAVRACGVAAARLLGARPSHGGAHRPGASVAGVKRSGKRLIYIYIYMYIYTYIYIYIYI